jgi:hypothetical protein
MTETTTIESKRAKEGREILGLIVEFLEQGDDSSRQLWSILTALRGPDQNRNRVDEFDAATRLKHLTTAKIRRAIGMRFNPEIPADIADGKPARLGPGNTDVPLGTPDDEFYRLRAYKTELRAEFPNSDPHFRDHVAKALLALEKFGLI